jgi:hypothetical protein
VKLSLSNDVVVRRASVHLLRSIVTSCQMGIFTVSYRVRFFTQILQDLKESSSKITSLLRRIRAQDCDSSVRLHADLALLEAEIAIKESIDRSLDTHTRIIS